MTNPRESPFLTAALRFADFGWPVFPCESHGKRPRTSNGLLDATTDREKITRWWTADGNASIAIRTGQVSGLVVLDVDVDHGGDEALRDLERQHGALPATASVVTPSGGQHYYFRHPGGDVPNSAGKLGPGLDIRGDGGYVLAPPSIGANGRRYEADERTRLAKPPPWLVERLTRPHGPSQRVPVNEWVSIVRDGLPEGQRNVGMTPLVGHLLSRNVDARLVLELAYAVNRGFRRPMDPGRVDQIVESISGRELRKRQKERAA